LNPRRREDPGVRRRRLELYDTSKDWSQAKEMPEKLHELQRLSLIEATRYNVLPMDDDLGRRLNADTAGRPVLIKGKTQILFGGMGHLSENTVTSVIHNGEFLLLPLFALCKTVTKVKGSSSSE
jgi:hypothetical protein